MCGVFREAQLICSAVRYGLIESMRQIYSVTLMCLVLDVSEESTPTCERENARLEVEIPVGYQRTRETDSAKRVHRDWPITVYRSRHTVFEHCASSWVRVVSKN